MGVGWLSGRAMVVQLEQHVGRPLTKNWTEPVGENRKGNKIVMIDPFV